MQEQHAVTKSDCISANVDPPPPVVPALRPRNILARTRGKWTLAACTWQHQRQWSNGDCTGRFIWTWRWEQYKKSEVE